MVRGIVLTHKTRALCSFVLIASIQFPAAGQGQTSLTHIRRRRVSPIQSPARAPYSEQMPYLQPATLRPLATDSSGVYPTA